MKEKLTLGQKIKKTRERKDLSQETLAKQLYVTRQALSYWELDKFKPSNNTVKKISEILGVPFQYYINGDD